MSCWFAFAGDFVRIADPDTTHKKDFDRIGVVERAGTRNTCTIRYGSDGPVLQGVSIFELVKVDVPKRDIHNYTGVIYGSATYKAVAHALE